MPQTAAATDTLDLDHTHTHIYLACLALAFMRGAFNASAFCSSHKSLKKMQVQSYKPC